MITLAGFYAAFSPACFSLLGLWLVVIQIRSGVWLNPHRKKQAYAVTLFFAAPGTMTLLALIDPASTLTWRVIFIFVSVLGVAGMVMFGAPHHPRHHDAFDVSDQLVYWLAIGIYVAIAVLAFLPQHTLRLEGVLLTVLMLLGVLLALMLMFAEAPNQPEAESAAN
jgi:hypothetical protein